MPFDHAHEVAMQERREGGGTGSPPLVEEETPGETARIMPSSPRAASNLLHIATILRVLRSESGHRAAGDLRTSSVSIEERGHAGCLYAHYSSISRKEDITSSLKVRFLLRATDEAVVGSMEVVAKKAAQVASRQHGGTVVTWWEPVTHPH
ncbi:hypothetical protein C8T65DRAFT_693652 [Cerioporus squamosus]|nr:hypothetical protein C8T65DRAFT_693652 [Cerioporus squamosus]